ncbi:MAG: NAD(P)-binding protein [Bdellovibrionaceae bacterium]|nr:NAD(P)-binding protein [Pseudobdellovibrionaceae bacterium]
MKRHHAVVVGGGFSGLLAAKILSENFKKVTLVDKEQTLGLNRTRSGVAQGAHLHVLLQRGQKILQNIFPDIEDDFISAGCPLIDWANDTKWETASGEFPRYESEIQTYSMSRPFLDHIIFKRVSKIKNISIKIGYIVKMENVANGLLRIKTNDQALFEADLAVIAGGQNFNFEHVLNMPCFARFMELVPINITYRSVIYEHSGLEFDGCKQYYYQVSPPRGSIGAVISPVEGGRAIATIVEYQSRTTAKMDLAQFHALARQVPSPDFYSAIENAKAISRVSVFKKTNMFLRSFHKIANFPQNIFVMGDAFCSLNPVFGQGMSLALEQVLILRDTLKTNNPLADQFHKKIAAGARLPFLLAQVGSSMELTFLKRYLFHFLKRCQKSERRHRFFLEVLHLVGSYRQLFDFRSLVLATLFYD